MSGLDKILAEIQSDAEISAKKHIDKANVLAEEISKKSQEDIDKKAKEFDQISNAKATHIMERARSAAELESRKILLNKKQELIARALNAAKDKLQNLDDNSYFDVLIHLAKTYTSKDTCKMQLSKDDLKRLPKDFESKLPTQIKLSKESADIKNGFLLIYEGIDINCSFDALFEDKAEQLQDKAASILFN